jgi:hydroxymethylglutaryl-CoA lyase
LYSAVAPDFPEIEIGVHLHSRAETAAAKVRAAFDAGCRRFDSAVGGMGGCPFAGDHLVGNLPTEAVLSSLPQARQALTIDADAFSRAQRLVAEIRARYGCA